MAQATAPVLIVDDDEDCRALIATVLGMLGFKVVTARDGAEALVLAKRHRPCLILLDVMMPGMDGFSFRDAQVADPELARIPVILISALPDEQTRGHVGRLPAVAKPIEIDALIDRVVTVCEPNARQ